MRTENGSVTGREYPLWLFILLPAITMLLGWGLRGFIGGGPFGAMIPGAMIMITICMLLHVPFLAAAVMVVFGTAGIGIGGEMTYGQTLGFLRNPDTVWWGTCGTTIKGSVWGLVGGTVIGLGLVHRGVKTKTIITGFVCFLVAFVIGLKMINDPRLIYFSDRFNKPRQESWGGLLFGAIALLTYLKVTLGASEFRVIFRFARLGLAGGALGFGLGAFWLVFGFQWGKNFWITEWWKLMEFSFGFIMGGFFGYAAWLSRKEINTGPDGTIVASSNASALMQLVAIIIIGALIYMALPMIDPFVDAHSDADNIMMAFARTVARVLINYTFVGFSLIVIALRWPLIAFQIAVTLTFSHTMLDLVEDLGPEYSTLMRVSMVVISSVIVSLLVSVFQRRQLVLKSMLLILVWSTVAVAIVRMLVGSHFSIKEGHGFFQFIIGDMLVFNFFIVAAVIVSVMTMKRVSNVYTI